MFDLFGKYQIEITGLLTVIILGAIGTALWEVVLKPPSSWLLRKLLSAATFGLKSAKIIIYKRIASGQEEPFAKFIAFYFIIILYLSGIIVVADYKYNIINKSRSNYEKVISLEKINEELINPSIKDKLSTFEKPEIIKQNRLKEREEIKKLKNEIINLGKEANRSYVILIIFLIIVLTKLWVEYIILVYINSAIRYFNQLFRICSPLINDTERLNHLSEFARIKSPQEYKKLIESLKEIAKKHEFGVPSFWVWGYNE